MRLVEYPNFESISDTVNFVNRFQLELVFNSIIQADIFQYSLLIMYTTYEQYSMFHKKLKIEQISREEYYELT